MGFICTECDGAGCEECGDTGEIEVTDCPLLAVTGETMEFVRMAQLYIEHGLPAVAGGQLDQTQAFIEGALFVSRERKYWKARFELRD